MRAAAARLGVFYAVAAYTIWGLMPMYWKLVREIPADRIVVHRIFWAFWFLLAFLLLGRGLGRLRTLLLDRKQYKWLILSALLIAANWFTFVYATVTNQIVEAGLGYLILPLISFALGTLILKERLWPAALVAVLLATAGVAIYIYDIGRLPLISLVLSLAFAFYGLIRKISGIPALSGLTAEMAFLLLPAAVWIFYRSPPAAASPDGPYSGVLLALGGLLTAVPLLFFVKAAPQLRLGTLGILQYIAPFLQVSVGIFVYDENFSSRRVVAFVFIAAGLALYSGSAWLKDRRS